MAGPLHVSANRFLQGQPTEPEEYNVLSDQRGRQLHAVGSHTASRSVAASPRTRARKRSKTMSCRLRANSVPLMAAARRRCSSACLNASGVPAGFALVLEALQRTTREALALQRTSPGRIHVGFGFLRSVALSGLLPMVALLIRFFRSLLQFVGRETHLRLEQLGGDLGDEA